MRRFLFLTLAFIFSVQLLKAQELNATVRVTAPKLQTTDPAVFKTMETAILEFFNSTNWTPDAWELEERIECAFQINITEEISSNAFRADIAYQALRPVYGSDYKTATVSWVDKDVIITYEQYQPIQESRDNFTDNLSSVLTFYAYTILGWDYDTFSELGGEPYFLIAQGVINTIPPQILDSDKGWSTLNNRNNRYWMIENLMSPRLTEYRKAMYLYHRGALDYMATDVATGLQAMTEALKKIDELRSSYPNSMVLRMFPTAKGDEIIEIYKGADRTTKSTVQQIMRKLDVSNASKYNVLGQ